MNAFFLRQARRPSGWFGRHLAGRLLNRLNASDNRITLAHLQLRPGDRLLDIGFGGGVGISCALPLVDDTGLVAGVDIAEPMLRAGRRRFRKQIARGLVDLRRASAEFLPFDDNTFTHACSVNTIYFWPHPLRALRQVHRVLIRGGLLGIEYGDRTAMQAGGFDRHGFRLYAPAEIEELFARAGFTAVYTVPHGADMPGQCTIGSAGSA